MNNMLLSQRKSKAYGVLRALLAVGIGGSIAGIVVSIIISARLSPQNSLAQFTAFQNHALTIGAIVGFIASMLALLTGWILINKLLIRFWYIIGIATGGLGGLITFWGTFWIINISANTYGMKPDEGWPLVFDCILLAALGLVLGSLIGISLINKKKRLH